MPFASPITNNAIKDYRHGQTTQTGIRRSALPHHITSHHITSHHITSRGDGVGKLASESGGGLTRSYYYGAYSPFGNRTDWQLHDYGGEATAFTATIHDGIGRPWKQIDPLHFNSGTENLYNEYGYLRAIRDLQTGDTLYTAQQADVRGNITHSLLLGGETVERVYDPATGRLQVIKSSTLTGNGDIQHLSYSWDTLGNMSSRNDLKHSQQQSFCYDALNRLTKSHNNLTGSCNLAPSAQDQEYDGFGNITRKTGVGTYTYSTNMKLRPHAVTNAGGTGFMYDYNGNVFLDGTGRSFTYATFDLPTRINKGVNRVEFSYGADRARWKRVDTDYLGTPTVTLYMGNVERIQVAGGITRYRRTIGDIAIFNYNTDMQLTERLTLFKDVLGSVVATRNVLTGAQTAMAFNPWGERVLSTNVGSPLTSAQLTPYLQLMTVPTTRGFTGHEMVDSMGLIHMNGRIYDARIGRFLQADIQVDGVSSTQGYNRYSYGQNNPLNGWDPSGFGFFRSVAKVLGNGGIIGSIVGKIFPQLQSIIQLGSGIIACSTGNIAVCASFNAAATYGNGGSVSDAFKAGAIAGVSAFSFSQIGAKFTAPQGSGFWANGGLGHIGAHAVTGGIVSVLQGGKFGHGFVSAGLTKGLTPAFFGVKGLMVGDVSLAQASIAAIVGGTIYEITGGKFANGAMTAAFANIFNQQDAANRRAQEGKTLHKGQVHGSKQRLEDVQVEGEWTTIVAAGDLAASAIGTIPHLAAKALAVAIDGADLVGVQSRQVTTGQNYVNETYEYDTYYEGDINHPKSWVEIPGARSNPQLIRSDTEIIWRSQKTQYRTCLSLSYGCSN